MVSSTFAVQDEQHARKIEIHAQVVVAELAVLLGIQHLEQRAGRVAMETARAGLVDLVEHQYGIARCGTAQRLDDIARQRADIRAPVAANLRLVVHASQRHALKDPPGGASDGLAQRGLADAGRAGKAQYGTLALRIELAHRQVLQDASLDLVQAKMIRIENPARLGQIYGRLRRRLPRQLAQAFEVGTKHRDFRAALAHALQALEVAQRVFQNVLGHACGIDGLLQVLDLRRALLALAQLFLDLAQLFTQNVLALAFAKLRARLVADFLGQLENLGARRQQAQNLVQAPHQIEGFQDVLLFLILGVDEVATMSASTPGESMARTTLASSSGTCGSRPITSIAFSRSCRKRASTLAPVVSGCATMATRATGRAGHRETRAHEARLAL